MPKQNKPRRKRGWHRSWLLRGLLLGLLLGVVGLTVVLTLYGARSLKYDISKLDQMPERSTVYDMNAVVYRRLFNENRVKISIDQVSPNFINALLAREDSRFYQHDGIDYLGIGRAILKNITHMKAREGASTLTQQLARNSYSLGGKTLDRKLLEAVLAKRIEQKFSKKEILESYVNRIFFGSGMYGVETASLAYFGKPSAELSLGEAAMLAGIIRSPNRLSPFKNLEAAKKERDSVLARMVKLKFITQDQADSAKKATVKIAKQKPIAQESYFMDAVRRELDILLAENQADEGGLRIYTTIDPELQKVSEVSLEAHLAEVERRPGYKHPKKSAFTEKQKAEESQTPYLQGAVVVIDNRNGAIRALVGGRDYSESRYNRAVHPNAGRQIGSAFKPFIYAAAFSKGMLPGMLINDGPLQPGEITGGSQWNPSNSDGKFLGYLPASTGLIRSRNTMSIRVGEWAGLDRVRKLAADSGLGTIPNQPVIYLGAFEETLRDITSAFTIFPNQGLRRQTYLIERIDNAEGEPIYRAAHLEMPVLPAGAAWLTSQSLEQVFASGTATSAKNLGFDRPAGGKTGTTNDFKDAWFLGYTSSLTCGVWVGLDTPETITGRGYGSTLALPIWVKVMKNASPKRFPADPLRAPEPIRQTAVCAYSNALATQGCYDARVAYTTALPLSLVPRTVCTLHPEGHPVADRHPGRHSEEEAFGRRLGRSFRRFFGRE